MMSESTKCEECRNLLDGSYEGAEQPQRIDAAQPGCACENVSVGLGSPGIVRDEEVLYRLVISPGEVDDNGVLLMSALDDVRKKGLSVFRECATDDDIIKLVGDRLSRKSAAKVKKVEKMIKIKTEVVRSLSQENFGRMFCVYDETVPRKNPTDPRVEAHATVLQRLLAPKSPGRKQHSRDIQSVLYSHFSIENVNISEFRSGIIAEMNKKSESGEFVFD